LKNFWDGFEKRAVSNKWLLDRVAGGVASRTAPGAASALKHDLVSKGALGLSRGEFKSLTKMFKSNYPKKLSKKQNVDRAHQMAAKYPKPTGGNA